MKYPRVNKCSNNEINVKGNSAKYANYHEGKQMHSGFNIATFNTSGKRVLYKSYHEASVEGEIER